VRAVLPAIAPGQIRDTIRALSGMPTRYYQSRTGAEAARWLQARWRSLTGRPDVTIELVDHGYAQPSVVLTIPGAARADEVVVIGGHLDSWDVGQGAHDDGTGVVMMMQALRTLHALGLAPRRTIRVVLFTNEENGVRGGKGYAADHAAELPRTVLAIESDGGGFSPRGFDLSAGKPEVVERVRARVADIASLLRGIAPMQVRPGYSGTDIEPMEPAGVPGLGLRTDNRTYFDIHHTDADTLDKVDPQQLADDVAAVAVMAYVAADLPGRLDAP
jgi:carboxypeptidase Q